MVRKSKTDSPKNLPFHPLSLILSPLQKKERKKERITEEAPPAAAAAQTRPGLHPQFQHKSRAKPSVFFLCPTFLLLFSFF